MSTQTTHYGLAKPDSGDPAAISAINGNMDIIDGVLNDLSGAVAIIQRTDTATQNIAEGDLVLWKGVLHKASSAITSGDTLSETNLTEVTGGGLNNLMSSAMEIREATDIYTMDDDDKEYCSFGINIYNSSLNGKKIYSVVGFSTGMASVACTNCHLDHSKSDRCTIWYTLRNLNYPSAITTSHTFRVKYLVG
jgi:hypothetical protein